MTEFTIIIPTYNRPAFLRRSLDYYDNFGEHFNIIVADSSLDKIKKLNENITSTNNNISYFHDHPSTIEYSHKIADAISHVNTKYCVLCADDDFITPNGIKQSVDFLEKNPDFTVAHGRYIAFRLKSNERKEQQFLWQFIYSPLSTESSDPKCRLEHHLSDYATPTIYAVHRADFIKMVLQENIRFTDDDRFGELLPSMLTLIYGKMKCLDVLYAAREVIPDSAGRTSKGLTHFGKENTYQEKYQRFRACLSVHLSQQGQLDIEESKKVVDRAMSVYLEKCFTYKSKVDELAAKSGLILSRLNLPGWLDKGLRRSYTELTKPRHIKKYSIDMSPSSKYYEDFNKIRLHVLAHSK